MEKVKNKSKMESLEKTKKVLPYNIMIKIAIPDEEEAIIDDLVGDSKEEALKRNIEDMRFNYERGYPVVAVGSDVKTIKVGSKVTIKPLNYERMFRDGMTYTFEDGEYVYGVLSEDSVLWFE